MEKRNLMNLYVAGSLRSLHTSYAPNTFLFQLCYIIPPTFTPLSSIAHLPLYTPSCFLSLDQRPLLLSRNANLPECSCKRFCFFHMAFSKWWYFTLFRSTKHDSLRTINKGPTNQKQRGNEKSQQHQHFVTFFLFSGPVAKKQMFSTTKHPTTLCLSEEFPPSFQLSSWMRSSRLWPPRTSENPPSVSTKVTSEV